MNRREFIGGAMALPLLGRAFAADGGRPLLRFGVMTDTHVGRTVESCGRVKLALELFKAKGCELVINNGDIADHHYPEGYRAYRQVFDGVFAGGAKPREIYVYAWHDAFAWHDAERGLEAQNGLKAFADVQALLQAPNSHTETVELKGYRFVVMPQFVGYTQYGFISMEEYEKRVAAAVAASPGRPVFVVDHLPCGGVWGNSGANREKVLDKFPQVVYLCGHAHGSLRNDLMISQNHFTAINSGCLQNWGSGTFGYSEARREHYGVVTVDVYADRLDVRRWDVRDGSEICSGRPWVVPLPFVAAKATWSRAEKAKREPVAEFAAGAAVSVKDSVEGFLLEFPSAGPKAFRYTIKAEGKTKDGAWRQITWRQITGDWWQRPEARTGRMAHLFGKEAFLNGETVRFAVMPVNAYGVCGKTVLHSSESVVKGIPAGKVVLESKDPCGEFGVVGRKRRKPAKPDAEGWYGPMGFEPYVKLPEGRFEPGKTYRAVIEMETARAEAKEKAVGLLPGEVCGVGNIRFANAKGPGFASGRTKVPAASGPMRYVVKIEPPRKGRRGSSDSYNIYFEHGEQMKMKITRLEISALD